jgi:oligoendopeptidase F
MSNLTALPEKATDMLDWSWPQIEPHYTELLGRSLSAANVHDFLSDWTRLVDRVGEVFGRLMVAEGQNTADKEAEARHDRFLEGTYPNWAEAEQRLTQKLLQSGLAPDGFERPLRRMQADAGAFCEANLALEVESAKLCSEYSKITGSQTVQWEGREVTLAQLKPALRATDRERREQAWRLSAERQLADRAALNELWQKLLKLRVQMAANAGFSDFRSYCWQLMHRFDYTPENCKQFHWAIEEVATPAAARACQRRAKQLGLEVLRPWDLDVDPLGRPALAPFQTVEQLRASVHSMLTRLDSEMADHFQVLTDEGLLDLESRANKAAHGYCVPLCAANRAFISVNAVGLHDDVTTLIHESGHAYHFYQAGKLPYFQQRQIDAEFAEVASMGMELLASPYMATVAGGFYSPEEATRALNDKLGKDIQFWPYMAVVDAFQHWVYENPEQAMEPANCDRQWTRLWHRFVTDEDWSDLEDAVATGWHRKFHIFQMPFYYVEYGLAQLGAYQVWANVLKDQARAVAAYKRALALGGTKSLPELYATAGAKFAFDAGTLGAIVALMEEKLDQAAREFALTVADNRA